MLDDMSATCRVTTYRLYGGGSSNAKNQISGDDSRDDNGEAPDPTI